MSNCTLNKIIRNHGVKSLDLKHKNLVINTSNKNDIVQLLGQPSTKSDFDENLLIYIERATGSTRLMGMGKKKLLKNNVLILEIDKMGILKNKIFLTKKDINNISFSKEITAMTMTQRSFIYSFFSSMRQKINDPLGKKK
jgi:outer membrane protein assembly factor BamE (lipoprotein component of BamABCDE complex)